MLFIKKKAKDAELAKAKEAARLKAESEAQNVAEEPKPETVTCPKCGKELDKARVVKDKYICYECGSYFRVKTKNRIKMVTDSKTFEPWFEDMPYSNPLNTEGYEDKVKSAQVKTNLREAVTIGKALINGEPAVVGVCDARFLMSSMGYVVGEKIVKAVERATEEELPVFIFCCSGGARMQEGIVSLMQMAKTSAAIKKHSDAGLLYVPILTDPTTGGVTASFAMLGDIILGEPGALVGFAGPRVIKQTIGQELPAGFQRSEFLVEHGIIDGIVTRDKLKDTMYRLIVTHKKRKGYANFNTNEEEKFDISEVLKERLISDEPKTPWEKLKGARQMSRPSGLDYAKYICDDFTEIHGDRTMNDDRAVVGGIGHIDGQPVTVISQVKGASSAECMERNFGMPLPDGYRKALRLMKQAEKFNRPIITFVNTPGAFCGLEAEERGMGEAIARNLYEMSSLKVPVLAILIGEGGSGGALALAVGNQVWMLENATYSILSPEGYASILWKDSSRAEEAAEVMKITAQDLKELGIIEQIIPEYGGADELSVPYIGAYLKKNIKEFLEKYSSMTPEEIAEDRYKRFRAM
jgi:acetyl-CoA carboxylase carboxyl transferase alpha subunit/acetyl-CoA carboxylase carboxyl transferase beta subunit